MTGQFRIPPITVDQSRSREILNSAVAQNLYVDHIMRRFYCSLLSRNFLYYALSPVVGHFGLNVDVPGLFRMYIEVRVDSPAPKSLFLILCFVGVILYVLVPGLSRMCTEIRVDSPVFLSGSLVKNTRNKMASLKKMNMAKFCLVQFTDDDIYHVCSSKCLILNRQGMFLTMWVDRQFYLAKVLASSNNRQRLIDLKKNLENNLPVVSLQRLKPQDINSTKKSCETVCENEEVFQKQTLTVCNYCGILFEDSHECVLEQETRMTSLRCVHESVEGFQAGTSDLCMYCGMLVSNFNEHVLSHDPKYVADKDDAESIATVKYPTKQHYCVYCKQLQTKLARHLERKHKNESDVQNAMKSAKGSRERKLLFAQIQKKGDFCYKSEFQVQINVRRNISKKTENISIPCPYCKGFYSKSNLRNHLRLNCWVQHSDKVKQFEAMGLKNVQAMSRSIFPQIHERASVVLREKVFPVLNNDEVTRAVAHDELVIIYANLLVIKYSSSSHHHRMIRNKIRHIARILLAMKKINPRITDTASIFDPLNFDVFIEAVHNLAGLSDGHFAAPSVGPTSITLICKLGDVLQVEAIKKKDVVIENNVKQFLKLVTTTANALVTKTAIENRTQGQRSKVVTLPETEDVNQLYHSLSREMERCIEQLSNGFDSTTWVTLNKVTLTKIMIFNRKRPGDIERSQIVEYRNLQMVSEETLAKLNAAKQKIAVEFGRYIARGKLDTPAPVLVSKKEMGAIDLILKYRHEANVNENNPFLFATPEGSRHSFYCAGIALKEFCQLMGLQSKNLTATKLRKHLATVTCTLDDKTVKRISNFMGHSDKYHQNIYVQRPILGDVVEMGQVLSDAMGQSENTNVPTENIFHQSIYEENVHQQSNIHVMNNNNDEGYAPDLSVLRVDGEASDCGQPLLNSNKTKHSPLKKTRTTWTTLDKPTEVKVIPCEMEQNEDTNILTENIARQTIYQESNSRQSSIDVRSDDDYDPSDLSTVSEESEVSNFGKSLSYRKRRIKNRGLKSLKKTRVTRKHTWTTPERETVRTMFKQYLTNENMNPSLDTCQQFKQNHSTLQNRTATQIKSWIIQEKRRMLAGSPGWNTPVKQFCRTYFKQYYATETYPSSADLQCAINENSQLSHTTVPKLKSHLQHDYKYLKKKKLF